MSRNKKYQTEEERKAAKKEYNKQRYQRLKEEISRKHSEYYQNHKEEILEKHKEWKNNNPTYNKEYYQKNKDRFAEYGVDYYKNNREKRLEYSKQYQKDNSIHYKEYQKKYHSNNKETLSEKRKEYYIENKEKINLWKKHYSKTPMGRAVYLVNSYKRADKKAKRGECTLTPEWIVDNIFSKPCHYCGKEGWDVIGCDRIDNDKPHTEDNVVPCCDECNTKRGRKEYNEFIKIIKEKNK